MLDFIAQYGPAIASGILSVGAIAGATYNIIKCFKLGKKVDTTTINLNKQMEITREGIVEAFKTAKLPNDIKLSLSAKVDEVLTKVRDAVIVEFKKNEAMRTTMMMLCLKILSFTTASDKLTEEEKKEIEDLMKLINDEDATIEI